MREGQKAMALQVMNAYEEDRILLVEASTGVGKSWAYLAPALLWAATKKGITVISTHTITLQEQLLKKDIPFLTDVLNLEIQATLVKGMGNYFCFRKYEELSQEREDLSPLEQEKLDKLALFSETSQEGSFSDVSFSLPPGLWDKVSAERSSCPHMECPYFKKCFFFKARKQLGEAQVLVVNHHLLIAEIAARLRPDFQEDKSLLPKFSRLIVDEAHHLEEISLESFSVRLDRLDLIRYLGRIHSEKQPHKSWLGLLKIALSLKRKKLSSDAALLLDIDIPAKKREAATALEEFLTAVKEFCAEQFASESSSEQRERRWRLSFDPSKLEKWNEEIGAKFIRVQTEWNQLFFLIGSLRKSILQEFSSEEKEAFSSNFMTMEMIEKNLTHKLSQLERFVLVSDTEKRVRWVELSPLSAMQNITLVDARLNVSEYLKQHIFLSKDTAVLCSATLTSNRDFAFLRQQIGLEGEKLSDRVSEKIYESPFDFKNNALFVVPSDISLPHEPAFLQESCQMMKQIVRSSKGGCFLLFTSYDMLQKCYALIVSSADRPQGTYMRQGEAPRHELIERFKSVKDGVLFATSSFWEGIDIAGDSLRCVVLTKLPFKVPSEPFFQAMSEMVEKEGKDPFSEYSLPLACLKFKQGFGRLIRTQTDRGAVICLDKRVMNKSYGKVFLKSLPDCPVIYDKSPEIIKKLDLFYKNGA